MKVERGCLCVSVEDEGKPSNPLSVPAVDTSIPLTEKPLGKLGVHLNQLPSELREHASTLPPAGKAKPLRLAHCADAVFSQERRWARIARVRRRKNGDSANAASNERALQSELEGFVDIGMARDACRVAREILAQRRISAEAFNAVITAIEIVSNPKNWVAELDVAWARQSAAFKRETNWMMLALYGSTDEWEKALHHAAPRHLTRPSDFPFGIEALLRAGQIRDATRAARKASRALEDVNDEFDYANLIEALAAYSAWIGDHDEAFKLWSAAPRNQPFGRNAAEGRIELCLAKALGVVREELAALSDLPVSTEHDLMLPGNEESIRHDTEAALKTWQRAIEKLLPAKRWLQLGISET